MTTATKPPIDNTLYVIDPALEATKYNGMKFKVAKHLVKNVEIEQVPDAPLPAGVKPRRVRIDPHYLVKADAAEAAPAAKSELIPYLPILDAATVVTVAGPRWQQDPSWLYVVLGPVQGSGDRYRIARLGGLDGNRYWKVPRSWLTQVAAERIVILPA